ncbi:hypothetical protein NE237_013405 [Protea cynaroides]|uniref:Uncharacterized protein n=1 Tax=Protea cynaroides TaxID=273540 RepID=A0A9Q0H2X9_9MAGN|nr:hypothetical protein NE237_013405 [Protea cynaroides]
MGILGGAFWNGILTPSQREHRRGWDVDLLDLKEEGEKRKGIKSIKSEQRYAHRRRKRKEKRGWSTTAFPPFLTGVSVSRSSIKAMAQTSSIKATILLCTWRCSLPFQPWRWHHRQRCWRSKRDLVF